MRRGREAFEVLIANCKWKEVLKSLVFDDMVEFEIVSATDLTPGKPWGQPTKALSVLSQAGQTASDISKLRRAGKSVESRFG